MSLDTSGRTFRFFKYLTEKFDYYGIFIGDAGIHKLLYVNHVIIARHVDAELLLR